jgi:hypothetical protein
LEIRLIIPKWVLTIYQPSREILEYIKKYKEVKGICDISYIGENPEKVSVLFIRSDVEDPQALLNLQNEIQQKFKIQSILKPIS